jgi:hypothetical protein
VVQLTAAGRRGQINAEGWAIWYLFGNDDRGEYLDSYAAQRLEADFVAENQRVAALLEDKGFGLDGSEPVSVVMNRNVRIDPNAGA